MKKNPAPKKPRRNAPGGGRPAKGYARLVLYVPPAANAALTARQRPGETPGECFARLLAEA